MKELPSMSWGDVCKEDEDDPRDYSTEDLEKLKRHHESWEAASMTRMHPTNAEYMHFTEGGQHYLPPKHRIKYYSNLVSPAAAAHNMRGRVWYKAYNRICDELDRRKIEGDEI